MLLNLFLDVVELGSLARDSKENALMESESKPPAVSDEAKQASKHAAIRLSLVPGVGPRAFQNLLSTFGDAEKVLRADQAHLLQVQGIGSKLAQQISDANKTVDIDELQRLCDENQIDILSRSDDAYPDLLKEIHDPPNILYSRGRLQPEDSLSIAIVGSRHASHYGTTVAESLARSLAMAGFTVVSGLARGIDAAAHLGALRAGGRTVAVLGSGVLNVYPSEHEKLAKEIVQQGAVLSEFHPKHPPKSHAFPQRNRIVTGMCLGVIVVEAAHRSGALISARLANEQGREVFAVPGQINSRMSRGCHRLIRDGATLIENVDDVLQELGPLAKPARIGSSDQQTTVRHPGELKLTDQESKILNAIGVNSTQIDEVIDRTGLPAQRVLSTVSVLEMRKLIKRLSGTTVARI